MPSNNSYGDHERFVRRGGDGIFKASETGNSWETKAPLVRAKENESDNYRLQNVFLKACRDPAHGNSISVL